MKKIDLQSTSIMVTEYCSLNCKLCLAFVPYYTKREHLSVENAKVLFKNFFETVHSVDKLSITGGEPLVNMEIEDILFELLKYEKQINKEIIFITNGTIILSETLISIFKSNKKFKIIVNHYGSISSKAYINKEILEKNMINHIFYTEENRYGWIDCRDHRLKHLSIEERERQASKCVFWVGKKYVINRGKMYTCTRCAYRIQEKLIPYSENDYIDFYNDNIEIRNQKLQNFLTSRYSVSCAYCEGLTDSTPKYMAAEQLPKERM